VVVVVPPPGTVVVVALLLGPLVVVVPPPGPVVVVAPPPESVVVVVDAAGHDALVMVLVSSVVAPLRANVLPSIVAPVVTVIDVKARTVPVNTEFVPSVAELPTCQKTLQGDAPPMRLTRLAEAVVSVEPAWKIKTALPAPWASRVRVPVNPSEDAEL
jgi:hypothetical protein